HMSVLPILSRFVTYYSNKTARTEFYPLSLHDALPIYIESRISERTKAIVIINPNNPTGAVYSRETLENIFEVARKNGLVVLSDEIYEKILYDDAEHIHAASVADDVLVLTFSGLSKAYRVAGYRAGWVAVSG